MTSAEFLGSWANLSCVFDLAQLVLLCLILGCIIIRFFTDGF